jgi:hypothetical protein
MLANGKGARPRSQRRRTVSSPKKNRPAAIRLDQFLQKSHRGEKTKAGRFSVTFDPKLDKAVRAAAGDNISAWLAEAARDRLRFDAAAEFVREFESRRGTVTDEAMAEVEREWPR